MESPHTGNESSDTASMTVQERLKQAVAHHSAGRLAEAESLYRSILAEDKDQPETLHLSGVIALQTGRHDEAVELIGRATAIKPDFTEAYNNLGTTLRALNRQDEAISAYRKSIALKPGFVDAHYNLGVLYQQMKLRGEAASQYQQVIDLAPNRADAHAALASVLQAQGLAGDAVASFQKALALNPTDIGANIGLGHALQETGDREGAVAAYKKALEVQPDQTEALFNLGKLYHELGQLDASVVSYRAGLRIAPERAEVYCNLGLVLQEQGLIDEGLTCYRQALTQQPDLMEAHFNIGHVLQNRKQLDEAVVSYKKALEINPAFVPALNNIGTVLHDKGKLDEAVDIYQRVLQMQPDYAEGYNNLGNSLFSLGDIDAAITGYEKAVVHQPDYASSFSNRLLAEQYRPGHTAKSLYALHCEWDERYGRAFLKTRFDHLNSRDPDRSLRIGFVSADLGRHPVGYFAVGLLENLQEFGVETYCYSDRVADDLTRRIQAAVNVWRPIRGAPDEAVASMIRKDQIDILIDLTGHSAYNRLFVFARKPAPIQVAWAGYVGTTGLSAMDYLISDRFSTHVDEEPFYSEKVLRMPDQWLCYEPPDYAPDVTPLPARQNGFVTFASFSNPGKLNAGVISVWARILQQTEGSRLLLKYRGMDTSSNIERLTGMFDAVGIPATRVLFEGRSPHAELLARYNDVDIALDPFPYSGGITTYEALWMGVPVITVPGQTFASRHSESHLETIGYPEFIARDLDQYVALAVQWANDIDGLSQLRAEMRGRMANSPTCDPHKFSEGFAGLLRMVWRDWCHT